MIFTAWSRSVAGTTLGVGSAAAFQLPHTLTLPTLALFSSEDLLRRASRTRASPALVALVSKVASGSVLS